MTPPGGLPGLAQADAPRPATLPAAPGESERVYFPQLDGLRFVAFLLVYLFHGGVPQFAGWVDGPLRFVSAWLPGDGTWARRSWGYVVQQNGWTGVMLFFVLSGYLITTLLIREERRFGSIHLGAFWARRILRIWPLYYWILFLGFVALPLLGGYLGSEAYREQVRRHLPAFLLFLGNWSMGWHGPAGSDAVGVLWSVCVEEQFYIVGPLLIALVPRRGRIGVVVALMAFAVAWRHRLAASGPNPVHFAFSTLTQLDTLLAGVLLALVLDLPGVEDRARRWSGRLGWPAAAFALFVLSRPGLARGDVAAMTWGYVLIWAAAASVLLVLLTGEGPVSRLLARPRVVWLGRISYGLYMYHILGLMLGRWAFAQVGWFPFFDLVSAVGCLALTVGMAALSYRVLERPFLRFKTRWARVASRPID